MINFTPCLAFSVQRRPPCGDPRARKGVHDGHSALDRLWPRRRHRGEVDHARAGPGGIILTIVLGVVGALLGGWLGRVIGLYREGEAAGFIMAVGGARGLLALYPLALPSRDPPLIR